MSYRVVTPRLFDPLPQESLSEEAARARAMELEVREEAASIVAAYLGAWNMTKRCLWVMRDGGWAFGSEVTLEVDGRAAWRCWWESDAEYRFTLRVAWFVDPWNATRRHEP